MFQIKRFSLPLLSVIGLSGCMTTPFERVDFKYDNTSHMTVDNAMVELDIAPRALIYTLSDSFTAQGNALIERQELDFHYEKAENAQGCWNASRDVFQQEFHAYQLNDFSAYNKIDRAEIFKKYNAAMNCHYLDIVKEGTVDSWFLKVEIPQGNYNTTISVPNVETFFAFSGGQSIVGSGTRYSQKTVSTQFSSMLYVWAWKEEGSNKTKVYLLAKPVNEQVESCAGCSIGHKWWKQANGYAEFKLVQRYKFLLEDLSDKLDLQEEIQKKEAIKADYI